MYIDAKTDIGSTREENQDNFWSAILNINNKEVGVACVCDGMGGLNNGGLASRTIIKQIRESILKGISISDITKVLIHLNQDIKGLKQDNDKGMGSTCTLLYCSEGVYTILHVGDSRCYKIDAKGEVFLLSNDHSVIKKYGITKETNADLYNKYKSKLTNCIGVTDTVTIDTYNGKYNKGDTFLVCSDGFWHSFDEKMSIMDLSNLDKCIKTCIDNKETDNITVSILRID